MKMRRPLCLLAATVALCANGCLGNNASLTIIGLGVPDSVTCATGTGGEFLPELVVDLTVARSALAAPIVRNSMRVTPAELLTGEVHTFMVEGVNVRFRSATATRLPDRYVSALGSVEPGVSLASVPFELLSARDIDILRGDRNITNLIANIKVSGRLTGGGYIASSEVPVSIRLCRGCLQNPLPNLGCCAVVEPSCATHVGAAEVVRKDVCRAGVNEVMDYCSYEERRR